MEDTKPVAKRPATTKKSNDATTESSSRVFRSQTTLHHDLFLLSPESMLKDIRLNKEGIPDREETVAVKHQHFFHTIDSAGRKQDTCSPIGGHFHVMEVIDNGPNDPPTVKCVSGPMRWGIKRVNGKNKKVPVPANEYDDHTHDITYVQSEMITPRKANAEAAKVQANVARTEAAADKGGNLGGQIIG